MTYSVVIPTRNAGQALEELLQQLWKQQPPPKEIWVIDSASTDATVELARENGASVLQIEVAQFDHGGARNLVIHQTSGDVAVCLTQDALPVDGQCMARLLRQLEDPHVAACGARQVARTEARPYEKLVREYNYPRAQRCWTKEQASSMGIRAYMLSNVCTAYRRSAWDEVGGFDQPVATNEDMLMAQKLLDAGWSLCYCGEAQVWHSHNLTWRQQFQRNFQIGRTLERYGGRFGRVKETGEGFALFQYVCAHLAAERKYMECVSFFADSFARLLGNRLGRITERKENVRYVDHKSR